MEPSALLLGLANAISPHAVRLASKLGKSKYDEFIATYTNVFSDHIASTLERCSRVKSLLHRDEALNIDDQYVELEFSTSNKTVTDKGILQSLTRGPDGVLVSGWQVQGSLCS